MENESTAVESVATPQCSVEDKATPCPVEDKTPVTNNKDERVDAMSAEIASLKLELQKSNIRSALAERRLIPHDAELVSKMVVDKIEGGLSPDEACASLYKSHPYLFKNTTSPKASESARAEEERVQKDLNDRLVSSAIARLKRDTVNF